MATEWILEIDQKNVNERKFNSTVLEHFSQFWLGFTMVVSEKIYLEAFINNQYICLKNDTAQLYSILKRAGLW